jgi:hypothetical protein
VLPELVKRNTGVLGMKSLANGVILKAGAATAIECFMRPQPSNIGGDHRDR